nr:biotin--[acetyl-CoA-carboxylase] ligase [uncultured Sellimonas sp.]
MREEEISEHLSTKWLGRKRKVYGETDSTNVRARQAAKEGEEQGLVILAESQTEGRGRRGRVWQSRYGENIYMTMLLRPSFEAEKAPMLTLLAACAVLRAIRICAKKEVDVRIKWPNDLVINGKKVCGILTEMTLKDQKPDSVLVGIGVNCNQTEFEKELLNTATSLKTESGHEICREDMVCRILQEFEVLYEEFKKRENLSFIKDEYEKYLVNLGRKVCVLEPGHEWIGVAAGIADTGELIVKTQGGEIRKVTSGEVSVRGIYGYV